MRCFEGENLWNSLIVGAFAQQKLAIRYICILTVLIIMNFTLGKMVLEAKASFEGVFQFGLSSAGGRVS